MASGRDIAPDTADVIPVNSNTQDIATLVRFGKASCRKVIQTFVWATAYNIVAIRFVVSVFTVPAYTLILL
jgi:Cu2+-exporting ATPase